MRHRSQLKHFSRSPNARKALVRSLVSSLVEHERIKTTLPKAKELRRHVERAITRGREGTIQARRLLMAKYPNSQTVEKLMSTLGVRFKDRPGGYTRILKLGTRQGDCAEMAFIEFVDYDPKVLETKTIKVKVRDAKRKQVIKEMTAEQKTVYDTQQSDRRAVAKKKHVRLMQNKSRRTNRKKK